jgi:hypothetical protein
MKSHGPDLRSTYVHFFVLLSMNRVSETSPAGVRRIVSLYRHTREVLDVCNYNVVFAHVTYTITRPLLPA